MALDFPASPTNGQTYTGPGGVIWSWDGTKWVNGTAGAAYAPIASPVFTGNPTGPTPAAGDADTSLATTAFVAAAVAPTLGNVGRNLLHNGLFNVFQRGTGPWTTVNAYTFDRWQLILALDAVSISIGLLADADRAAIGDESPRYSMFSTFTGNSGATANSYITQRVEDVRRLAGKLLTLSFWAKANSGTPKLGINLAQVFGSGGSPSAPVWATASAVTTGTTWARYSATITLPSIAGKTLGTANDSSTWATIWFSSGADTNALSGNIGVQSGTVQIWGVQLEAGTVATPLEKPSSPQSELADCQRYYQLTTAYIAGYNVGGAAIGVGTTWPVLMRAVPTLTLHNATGTSNLTGLTPLSLSAADFSIYGIVTTGGSATLAALVSGSADL